MQSLPLIRTAALLRWAAAVLMFSIFAHALIPDGSASRRSTGSAFSAFTMDVSLGPTRASERLALQPVPHAPDGHAGGDGASAILTRLAEMAERSRPANGRALPTLAFALPPAQADRLLPPSRAPPTV